MSRDEWIGWIQEFLEARIADAPDETCELLARDLLEDTYDLEDEA